MPNFSKPEIVLVRYPFSDLTSSKVRLAVVVNAAHTSQDLFVARAHEQDKQFARGRIYFSRMESGRFKCRKGLKRGISTIKQTLVKKHVGKLSDADAEQLEHSLRDWLDL